MNLQHYLKEFSCLAAGSPITCYLLSVKEVVPINLRKGAVSISIAPQVQIETLRQIARLLLLAFVALHYLR